MVNWKSVAQVEARMQAVVESLECSGVAGICAIRYSRDVMDEIRASAVEKFLSIPRGGIEIGGVLFGTYRDNEIVILAHEPVQIDYATGPSFVLAESDEVRFVEALELRPLHPEFGDLEPVGWYHSHTRSGICLTEEDVRLHERFFPRTGQIALVVKPFKLDPAQVGLFARDETGALKNDIPFATFDLRPVHREISDAEPKLPREDRNIESLPEPVPIATRETTGRRSRARVYLIAGLALAWTTAAIAVYTWPSVPASAPPAPFGLQLTEQANQLMIAWDRDSPAIVQAQSGLLKIRDGLEDVPPIRLDRVFLNRGTVAYARRTGDVQVTMRVISPAHEASEEVSRFIGSPPVFAMELPVPKVERTDSSPRQVGVEGERSRLTLPPPRFSPPQALIKRPAGIATPRLVEPAAAVISPAAGPPPIQSGQPVIPGPPPSPVKVPALTSGRAIWTGRLPKGGLLLIDSRRPSAGSITGQLPQHPARMRVYPADLADAGITVYTQENPRARVEAPSPANGWNLTTYTADPKKVKAITILENDGRKLLIRSEERTITMLVIQWEELSK